MKKITEFKKVLIVLLLAFGFQNTTAQIHNSSPLHIGDNNFVYLSSDNYYFGSGLGQTKTSRTASTYGKLIFSPNATWSGASDSHYIDGYATTKGTAAFVLPIGQSGVYAPVSVISTTTDGVDGAYYRLNPNSLGATLDTGVQAISTIEYWDIKGTVANAKISLTWRASSNLTSLSDLSLVGFDGVKWVVIPSTIDAISILGGTSTLSDGSITSDGIVNLSTFSAFSLGIKQVLGNETFNFTSKISVYPNPSSDVFFINSDSRGTFILYDLTGKIIKSENIDLGVSKLDLSNYASSVYLMKVTNENSQAKTLRLIKQ